MARKHAATTTATAKPQAPVLPPVRRAPATAAKPPAAPGLRAIEAAPPALSLHRAGSLAVLRIHDLSYSAIVSVIAQALPADISQLMLVTPTDTKMFNLTQQGVQRAQPNRLPHPAPNGAPAAESQSEDQETDTGEPDFDSDSQAETIRLAAEGDAAAAAAGLEEARVTAATAETPAERRRAVSELRRAQGEAGQDAVCGRCRGAKQIGIAMPDGGSSTAVCPVCQGRGSIRRYGAGRR